MSQRHQSYRRAIISWSSRPTSFVYLHCTMTESNSSIDSSFIFVGAEQSQVMPPSRPPTVTSDATFSSSMSTPTSPIDSNSSSGGTLEVRDQCHFTFHSRLEPTLSQPITLLPTLRIALAPAHHTPTIGLVVRLAEDAPRAGILSTGMAACVILWQQPFWELKTNRFCRRQTLPYPC